MADEVEDVEARDPLQLEQLRGELPRLLEHRRQQVAGLHLGAVRALHVQYRGLQRAAERHRLLRLFLAATRELFDLVREIAVELAAQRRQVGAAGGQDPFAVGVVQQRVEQVFERQIRVPARDRFAVRDVEDGLDRC